MTFNISFVKLRCHLLRRHGASCHVMSLSVPALSLLWGRGVVAGANPSCLWTSRQLIAGPSTAQPCRVPTARQRPDFLDVQSCVGAECVNKRDCCSSPLAVCRTFHIGNGIKMVQQFVKPGVFLVIRCVAYTTCLHVEISPVKVPCTLHFKSRSSDSVSQSLVSVPSDWGLVSILSIFAFMFNNHQGWNPFCEQLTMSLLIKVSIDHGRLKVVGTKWVHNNNNNTQHCKIKRVILRLSTVKDEMHWTFLSCWFLTVKEDLNTLYPTNIMMFLLHDLLTYLPLPKNVLYVRSCIL